MKAQAVLLRRTLMAAAVAAGWPLFRKLGSSFAIVKGPRPAVAASDALAMLCADLDCAPAIGDACLQAFPHHPSAEALTRLILSEAGISAGTVFVNEPFAHLIKRRSREDFRQGKTVMVDGWMLSLTETRLYALATQLRPTRPI